MASNPGSVPAGGRDKIGVVVNTRGYGGRSLTKSFTVTTNDPQHKQISLAVTGKVLAVMGVQPSFIRFVGFPGEKLSATVRLTPQQGFPFKVKKVETSDAKIKVDLKPLGQNPDKDGYDLVATTTRNESGLFRGMIRVYTDLEQKPLLQISVSGRIKPQQPEEKQPMKPK